MPGHSRGSGMPDRLVPVSRYCLQGMTKQARSRTGDQMRLPVTGPACQEKPCSPRMLLPRGPGPGTSSLPYREQGSVRKLREPPGSLQAPSLFMPAACSSSSATICSRMSAGASPGRASRASRRRSSSSLMLPSGYALRSTSRALAQPRLA